MGFQRDCTSLWQGVKGDRVPLLENVFPAFYISSYEDGGDYQ